MAKFKASKYQEAMYEWPKNGKGNGMGEAVAGSGKTTTLLEMLGLMDGNPAFLAFNKHIAGELASRAPAHAAVSTIHSLGFAAVRNTFGKVQVDSQKMRRITANVMGEKFEKKDARIAAEKLSSLVRLTLTDPSNAQAVERLMERHDIDANGQTEEVLEALPRIIKEGVQEAKHVIDFDDMVYLPTALNLSPKKHSWVCVDEAQDLNAAQRELVLRAVAPSGRVFAVGDRRQAVYGFAGADTSSIPTLTEKLEATTLPLSICYRCPSSHLDLARTIVPQIEARENAPKGAVEDISLSALTRKLDDKMGDLVICRVNKPLAEIALSLIRAGKKAVLRGRDLSSNLLNLIRKVNRRPQVSSLIPFLEKLTDYKERETTKLLRAGKDAQAESLEDRIETLIVLTDGIESISALENRISTIFSDGKDGVVCSSVHRAKGLEARRVAIFKPSLLPFPKAQKDWEIEQEWNLKYVALTRAKETLWMCEE